MSRHVKISDSFVDSTRHIKVDGEFVSLGGPPSMTNSEKLSLNPATAVGTQVSVTDGFVVSGFGDERDGVWVKADAVGTYAYTRTTDTTGATLGAISKSSAGAQWGWRLTPESDAVSSDDTSGGEDYPWQATWVDAGLTLTHPAIQTLTAPSTAQGGVFVSGGTQDGVYTIQGVANGRNLFGLLGSVPLGFDGPHSIGWNDQWELYDADFNLVYYSLSDVATPDLATNWKNASDDSPASITVTSVTAGEIAAGFKIGDVTYVVNGSENGRNKYSDVLGNAGDVHWLGPPDNLWAGDSDVNFGNVAFPWQGTPEVTATRDDVASEANWEVVE